MSKEAIEKIRIKLAAEREEKFRRKLAALVNELEADKSADDFFVDEILIPGSALA